MDTPGFRKYLTSKELTTDKITAIIDFVQTFETFLAGAVPTKANTTEFSAQMVAAGTNTLSNYYALLYYAKFTANDDVYIAVLDLLDGGEALENLHQRIGAVLGNEKQAAIFEGLEVSPLGTPNTEKVITNQKIMTRLEDIGSPEECDQIFAHSLRDLDEAWYADAQKLYADCGDIEEFLDKNAQHFIAHLEKLRGEGELFFSQEITAEVVEYVRSEPQIARGYVTGNILYEVKIPHQTKEFLAETDPAQKRYYYCHCPWVKESLKNGKSEIPPRFCECSAGFHKKRYELIFGQPLKAEIIESVLKGDDWCKIAIHLPAEAVPEAIE